MNYTDQHTYITTHYNRFAKSQFLEPEQFNDFVNYLDTQEKFTRLTGIGSGIICGFESKAYYNRYRQLTNITISQGLGITSSGSLLSLYNTIPDTENIEASLLADIQITNKTYSYFKEHDDYKVDPEYPPFYNKGEQVVLYELGTRTDAREVRNFKNLSQLSTKEELFVVLYEEIYDKLEKPCIGIDCDQPAAVNVHNLKVLLTNKAGIEQIAANDSTYKNNNVEALRDFLQIIKVKRPIISEQLTTSLEIKNAYESVSLDATLFDNLELYLGKAANFFGLQSAVTASKLKELVNPLFEASVVHGYQYGYNFIKDITETYNEIRALIATQDRGVCEPGVSTFKRHLMLGSLQNATSYRHGFYKAATLDKDNTTDRIKYLISRCNQMIMQFEIPTATEIKATESEYVALLGEKAIPWYYKSNDSFMQNWSYDLFKTRRANLNENYTTTNLNVNTTTNREEAFDWEQKDFFRIEGHQGQSYQIIQEQLKKLKNNHQIAFETIALSLTELATTTDPTKAYFKDFITDNPGFSHHGGVPEGGTLALLYESENNPLVIADLSSLYSCCLPKIPTTLGIPVDAICQFDDPIPLEVSPVGGVLTLDIEGSILIPLPILSPVEGEIAIEASNVLSGISAEISQAYVTYGIIGSPEEGYQFDPSLVPEYLLDQPLPFRINGKPVLSELTVLPAPTIESVRIKKVTYSEVDLNDATVEFEIIGSNIGTYTYEWDFEGNGNYVEVVPDSNGIVTHNYIFTGEEVATVNAEIRISGVNGCSLEFEVDSILNRVPSIDSNVIDLDISSTLNQLDYDSVIKDYMDLDLDEIANIQILDTSNNIDLQIKEGTTLASVVIDKEYDPSINFETKYKSDIANPLYLPKNIVELSYASPCETDIIEIDKTAYEETIKDYNVVTIDNQAPNPIDRKAIFQKIENTVEELPNDTIVYVHIDTSSLGGTDQTAIKDITLEWWEGFQIENPNFEGSLLINTVANNLISDNYAVGRASNSNLTVTGSTMKNGNVESWLENPAEGLLRQAYKEGLNTFVDEASFLSYVEGKSLVILSFVDESHSLYHQSGITNFSGEPSDNYIDDYENFINKIRPALRFFKGVLYPITDVRTGGDNAFLLHAMAAMKGRVLSKVEIDNLLGATKVAAYGVENMEAYFYNILGVNNPYEAYPNLEINGWEGRFDKTSPVTNVLNSNEFITELNTILTDTSTVQSPNIFKEIPIKNLGPKIKTNFTLQVTDDNPQGGLASNVGDIEVNYTIDCEDVPYCFAKGGDTFDFNYIGVEDSFVLRLEHFTLDSSVDKIRINTVNVLKGEFKFRNLNITAGDVPQVIPASEISKGVDNLVFERNLETQDEVVALEFTYNLSYKGAVNYCIEPQKITIIPRAGKVILEAGIAE